MESSKRAIAITFDDLPAMHSKSMTGTAIVAMMRKLSEVLCASHVPAVGFVNEVRLYKPRELELRTEALRIWMESGLELGNHTFSHVSLSQTSLQEWKDDVVLGETVISSLLRDKNMTLQYFRHAYLDMGGDRATRDEANAFLASRGYVIAPVTIDPADWMYADIYQDSQRGDDAVRKKQAIDEFLFYLSSVLEYCEDLSLRAFGREPKQILLLHANSMVADCLESILKVLQDQGYGFVTLREALNDEIYRIPSSYLGEVGTTWINHLAYTRGLLQLSEIKPVLPHWTIDNSDTLLPRPALQC